MAEQGSKGNPATKRMGNATRKGRRAMSWARGEKRKDSRRQAQATRERVNRDLREAGVPTRWEAAQAARAARRHQEQG